jgi:hypothetical protein
LREQTTNDQKARSWLALNREAKKFADQMNVAFPKTTAKGDKIFPEEAQRIAEKADYPSLAGVKSARTSSQILAIG